MTAAAASILVKAPVAAVYRRWLQVEDYPKFIPAIRQVRKLAESHYFASVGYNGKEHNAILDILLRVPERRLVWRTLSESHAPDQLGVGVVSFAPRPNESTEVTLKMTSSLGGALPQRLEYYLNGFKSLIESEVSAATT